MLFVLAMFTYVARAAYARVNVDPKTNPLMTGAYALEAYEEGLNAGYLSEVLDNYHKITLSTTGIFGSKWLERQAMAHTGRIGTEESYHYQRICRLVSQQITPRIIRCGSYLVKEPQNALYWGPYLLGVCTNVEELCKQFELVVTNGKVSFEDFPGWLLVTINPDLVKLFDLAKLGDVDWQAVFEKVGDFGDGLRIEDIEDDIKDFGGSIAAAGKAIFDGNLSEVTRLGKVFHSSPKEIYKTFRDFYKYARRFKDVRTVRQAVSAVIGDDPKRMLMNLFVASDLNIANYIDDYLNGAAGNYYRQRWYIYEGSDPSDTVYDEIYDSQSMSLGEFRDNFDVQLARFQHDDEEGTFHIGKDDPIYYNAADLNRLKGCDKIVYTARCSDDINMGEESFSFKVNSRSHNKRGLQLPEDEGIAMGTESGEANEDASGDIQDIIDQRQGEYDAVNSQLSTARSRYESIDDEIRQASEAKNDVKVKELEAEKSSLDSEIRSLEKDLSVKNDSLQSAIDRKNEYMDDIDDGDGDNFRLQEVMDHFQKNYQLSWNDGGSWVEGESQSVFIRHAYCGVTKTNVVFTAKITAQGRYKKWMGIRVHREMLNVTYGLRGDYTSENVVSTLELDADADESQKKELANNELRRLQDQYPSCNISMEYFYNKASDIKNDEDGIHLLWASDRLEVARDVDYRLTNINSNLMMLEKVLREHETLRQFFKRTVLNYVNRSRRANIAQLCFSDWYGAIGTAMDNVLQERQTKGGTPTKKDDDGNGEPGQQSPAKKRLSYQKAEATDKKGASL